MTSNDLPKKAKESEDFNFSLDDKGNLYVMFKRIDFASFDWFNLNYTVVADHVIIPANEVEKLYGLLQKEGKKISQRKEAIRQERIAELKKELQKLEEDKAVDELWTVNRN